MKRRLSSLDLLPEEAQPFLYEAAQAIWAGNKQDGDILFELNDKLAQIGCDPISRSAFSRHAVVVKAEAAQARHELAIMRGILPEIDPAKVSEQDVIRAELLKIAVFRASRAANLKPKDILDLSRAETAIQHTLKLSDARRKATVEERKAVDETIERIKDAKGLNAATKEHLIEALRGSIT